MIWIILILATILRLIRLDQSLWLDEAINIVASQNFTFWDFITRYPIGDFHPPLYFALLWIWTRIGGIGEIWVRLPSVIFGVVTVWLVYLLGKLLINKRVGLIAALFMALSPLHVYYSQEARMYSLAAFVATLSFYFLYKVIKRGNRGDLIGYGVINVLVFYSDYLVYLIFPAQFLYLIIFYRKLFLKFVVPWVVSVSTLIPWLTIFTKQLSTGTLAVSTVPGWASVVGGATLKELLLIPIKTFFGRVSIDDKQIYGLVSGLVGVVYGGIIISGLRKLDSETKLLTFWLFVPVVLAFLISFFIPVLSYFRLLFILPPFYILLAKGVDSLAYRERPWRLTVAGVCLISLFSLGTYYVNPKFQREDWREAVGAIDFRAKDGMIIFENDNLPYPFIYYSNNKSPAMGGLKKIPAETKFDISEVPEIGNIYLFEYLVDITDPNRLLEKEIERKGFKKVETLNFIGVGFVHHYQYLY